MPIPMRSMRCQKLCVEKDVGFSSDIYMNPTSRRNSGIIPPKKMREVDKAGSAHSVLLMPNFRKFGVNSRQWTKLPALSTPGLNPYHYVYKYPHLVWCGKEKKRKEKDNVFKSRETRSVDRNFHLILMKGTRKMGVYCVPS